jgi:tRNA (cmo5U34)-methyltransferase
VKDGSTVYDLGCSIGDLTRKLAIHSGSKRDITFIGVDIEADMIREAMRKRRTLKCSYELDFHDEDIINMPLEPADLIICYYTIQFIPPRHRQDVINKIYEALNWGGAFIMFEKVRAPDARFQDITSTLYTDYKLGQDYKPEEIINKTRSLKGILEPFSTQGNLDLLARAGFVDVMTVMKYICFEGFLAIK